MLNITYQLHVDKDNKYFYIVHDILLRFLIGYINLTYQGNYHAKRILFIMK